MKTVIHLGSESIDQHSHTQAQTDAAIAAITTNIPNADYIAVLTYLDYASDIAKWATSIHNAGKKMWLRSAGYNDWLGTNSVAQYTSSDFDAHATTQFVSFINSNYAIFRSGDIFSPVPDEPENNDRWNIQYGTIGSGAGQTAYNSFITTAMSQCSTAFTNNNITGVTLSIVATSPSASKDVITDATATGLSAICTDDFPETATSADPQQMGLLMLAEMNQWVIPNKATVNKHISWGTNVNLQLEQGVQREALRQEMFVLQKNITNLDGISVWQFGAVDNGPKSRLFDYVANAWVARDAASLVNYYFQSFKSINTPFKRIPLF